MPKPSITKRTTKGAALTYSELDTNFQNLADATLTLTAGSGGTAVTADLNGNITLVAGTGVTLTGNNTAKTVTINASAGSNSFGSIEITGNALGSPVVADSANDTLSLNAGTGIYLTTNPTNDIITIESTVTGLTNPLTSDLTLGSYKIIDSNSEAVIQSTQGLKVQSNTHTSDANVSISPGTNDIAAIASIKSGPNRDLNISTTASGGGVQSNITLSDDGSSIHCFGNSNFYLLVGQEDGSGVIRLVPMTTTERNSRTYTANGMIIYNEQTHKFQGYANGVWVDLH